MNINIQVIEHEEQRYDTCGDWWFDAEGTLQIRVTKLSDWRRESLIAVHELVEVLMCKHDGISTQVVDDFDKAFEAARAPGNEDEPGDSPAAPYVRQHCVATGVERILAAQLGVDWQTYGDEIEALPTVQQKIVPGQMQSGT